MDMSDVLLLIFVVFLLFVFVVAIGGVFLVAWLAARKRKQQQNEILKQVPAEAGFKMAMRYNKGEQHRNLIKLLPWQGSGILYVLDGKIHFRDALGVDAYSFDFGKVKIRWVGMSFANGFTEWFKIADDHIEYYFNVETGMLAFSLSSGKMTTYQVYKKLESIQAEVNRAG